MIKAIILDLDGTVGYTMPELQKAMNETLRSFGYPEHTVEELYQWVNFHAHEWIKGCFPDGCTDEEIAAGHKKYNEVYGKYYDMIKPFVDHEITLAYDEETRKSYVVSGYFGGEH